MYAHDSHAALALAVQEGLAARNKTLPAFMLYDERGSALFEEITRLPEYYLTRAERSIFDAQAPDIIGQAQKLARGPLQVLELGAGTATKSQILLHAMAESQGSTLYVPADVSSEPLAEASQRLQSEEPRLTVRPLVARHEEALLAASQLPGALFVWFLGSSIGNYNASQAVTLLRVVRDALGESGLLLLGADLKKDSEILLPAYDDAQGVTAAFNKNLLVRINRELGGHFSLDTFRHIAVWNEQDSRVEMYLESTEAQDIVIDALNMRVHFDAGERIHTESSHKYDRRRMESLLERAGLACVQSFMDQSASFAVHLARPN